ncbi:hypothetical protein ACFQ1Q_12065 [Winogradskyella litorisediminis]|uniref:Natural product n=1 Tax=Winogradskyella litorisediminis TaxID=1156618 RepID=A0ABW3NAQ3_9FLAO
MNSEKKKCCEGCKKGQLGTNKACEAKLMLQKQDKNLNLTKTKKL